MKIQHKRSAALDGSVAKEPTAAQTDFGEVCVNFNSADPALFIRDNDDNIIRVGGDLSLYQKIADNPPTTICATPDQIDAISPPAERVEGALWWNSEDGTLYVWFEDADSSQWVIAIPGNGFSGDYNDLTNKPNIPPEFNLDEGSVENDIIHWAEIGSVQEISSTEIGATASGNAYSEVAAQGGNGTGLTCNVVRRKSTGAHEVYVANRGQGYDVGDSVFLDLGYDPGSGTGSTGINCTIDQVNDTVDGWVARPGSAYYVSSIEDSLNTGIPQFMLGLQCGGNTVNRRIDSAAFPLVLEPIGDKATFGIVMTGNRNSNATPRIQFEAGANSGNLGELVFAKASDQTEGNYSALTTEGRFRGQSTGWQFQQYDSVRETYDNRFQVKYAGTEGVTLELRNGNNGNGIDIDYKTIKIANAGNSALRFSSTNGKYNFWKTNLSSGYQIDAEAGSAGFILAADAADASNYNAEGEYIGPVQDRVANLQATVATLQQEKADLLATVNDLVSRVEALENA